MTTAQIHRRRRTMPNAPQATKKRTRSRRVVGTKQQKSAEPRIEFSAGEWQDMVATAAYYRAEARGFEGGSPEDDWYEAEAELRERFSAYNSNIESASPSDGEVTDIETKGE